MSAPISGLPSASLVPAASEALLEHFDRAPIGMLMLAKDRTILRANETIATITGLTPSILAGSPFRRFLSSDAPLDLEERIFEDLEHSGKWLGELEIRTSIGETSPMMVSLTPVSTGRDAGAGESPAAGDADAANAASASTHPCYIVTVIEMGNQRWIEAESSRRAAELSAFASLAVATGSSIEPQAMLTAAAREIVEGLEVDACWIHRYEAGDSHLALVAEASYLNPSLRLSSHMIPDAINPGVLKAIQSREQVTESELLDRSIATVVHLPLLARDEVVGVMSILSVEGEKLTTRNSDLLRTVSYQVGTAIQNVTLLESVRLHQTELQGQNAQLEDLIVELREADRLKNEFLANTSHELRTPLNSIIGFLNLVLDGLCESDEERNELLGHALKSSKHLLNLINDVLDLSRIEAGRLQVESADVRLRPLLDELQSTMEVQAREKNLVFTCEQVAESLLVRGDEARLRQILVNVIGNAIKFTDEGSVAVTVDASVGSPFVEIAVLDTGIGISPEKRERLFRKFSQGDTSTTRKFGGSGLGLVIVKELVEMMGGSVRMESAGQGQGSAVTISIPRAAA
ncbi:MAG TPA: ATP-binding protein, partial [Candidatus Eisenbacteria bacterium]|nr:ATP-binding protein [Candidatus Eisenbacteria bacterium]